MSLDNNNVNNSLLGIREPEEKLKALSKMGNSVNVSPHIPLSRYYRSGTEMVRTAKMYLSEGQHENAYILYIRFMTLFLEKVQLHPEYKTFSAAQKNQVVSTLREVMPITENLKVKILDKYQKEYTLFLAQKEAERNRERAKQKERDSGGGKAVPAPRNVTIKKDPYNQPTAPDLSLLDHVVYPNDFPSGANKSGLLLPERERASPLVPTPDAKKPAPKKPTFDRSQKPSEKSSESLIEGGAFRTVIIPIETMKKFLNIASRNTNNNVETCGILAGCLAKNQLRITHIIIPKQQGTSDSCTTMNEEELFDIQDQLNLITLGWIHTHPSQTAFLSSVDLHTHFSYQIMMKEAVAIVCAPKYQETGFFCLTPHYGLDYIAQCRQKGFHPHPKDPPLFMEAEHIFLEENAKVEVVDLRNR
ncbi:STAMBPL1 family protein [Megaselia abdita]